MSNAAGKKRGHSTFFDRHAVVCSRTWRLSNALMSYGIVMALPRGAVLPNPLCTRSRRRAAIAPPRAGTPSSGKKWAQFFCRKWATTCGIIRLAIPLHLLFDISTSPDGTPLRRVSLCAQRFALFEHRKRKSATLLRTSSAALAANFRGDSHRVGAKLRVLNPVLWDPTRARKTRPRDLGIKPPRDHPHGRLSSGPRD